jgi:beta-lactamase regulating signal transducer with metallopeptidase domain
MDVVLNWFTQGLIVAILTAALLRLVPQSRAQARYGILWTACLLVLVLPAVPIVLTIASGLPPVDLVPAVASPVMTMPAVWWASPAAAVGLWMMWFCIQAVRLAVSVIGVRNVRRRARECPSSVLARLPNWSRVSLTGRRTRVVLSGEVRSAAVLGCGTPVIAVAPALIDELSDTDLDRVLVHEWAHVQRHDDLAQLAQRIAGTVIGWHPAAWWIERQLDFEREAACDEVAVSVTGSARGYATCLAMLATRPELRLQSVAALGASSSRLRERIVRILAAPRDAAGRPWRAITAGAGGGLLACTLIVANLQLVESAVTSAVAASLPRAESFVAEIALASQSADRTEPGPRPQAARRQVSRGYQKPATTTPENSARVDEKAEEKEGSGESLTSASELTPVPLQASPLLLDLSAPALVAFPEPRPAEEPQAPWTRAADVGVEVGRASRDAGVATAGLFTRFGKSIASAF